MNKLLCVVIFVVCAPMAHTEPTDREQEVLALINERRTLVNLPPMVLCSEMLQDSREWAKKLHGERLLYHWFGGRENCGRGYQTPRAIFNGWRVSPGHNALLHCRGAVYGAIGEHENYWVLRVSSSKEDYRERKERAISMVEFRTQAQNQRQSAYSRTLFPRVSRLLR